MKTPILIAVIVFVTLGLYVLRMYILPHIARKKFNQWLALHPQQQQIKHIEQNINQQYHGINGLQLSKESQRLHRITHERFTYGEIVPLSFAYILEQVSPSAGETFYDLGAGTGKALLTAAALYPFKKAVGIEFLPELAETAKQQIDDCLIELATEKKHIEIQTDDYFLCDFSEADIIFVNATCLLDTQWQKLVKKFSLLKSGVRIIVTTHQLNNPYFQLIYKGREIMSWGLNSVYIYRKN